jgi:hypothetical protein
LDVLFGVSPSVSDGGPLEGAVMARVVFRPLRLMVERRVAVILTMLLIKRKDV